MAWLRTKAFLAIFMAVLPVMKTQLSQPPLCAAQLALANHACALLSLSLPAPPAPSPTPPPSPPDDDNRRRRRRRRRGAHARRHHRNREEMAAEEDCCRWIKEVESECVCEVLVKLPAFLSRAVHEYSVTVGESCNVTYSCPGRLKI